ncbi:MAG: hypothetical protein HYU99_07775 [Deltaproteobacteria bacterium]|nr:hypothetical protein [Deltaproteobacteria bacterium]
MIKRGKTASILVAGFFILLLSPPAPAQDKIDFAVYSDKSGGAYFKDYGVWPEGVAYLEQMLSRLKYSHNTISPKDLNGGADPLSGYRVLLIPGGYAPWYNKFINATGKGRIRNFIKSGGAYLGICAGAYFAADRVQWINAVYDDESGYSLDLFDGAATIGGDLNKIADYYAGHWANIPFVLNTDNALLQGYKSAPLTQNFVYMAGPYFEPDGKAKITVLATGADNHLPAMVAFGYGSGRVILMAPHPEIGGHDDLMRPLLKWLLK